MSATTAASAAYIVAALLFILSLAGLSRHESAKNGNVFGIAGMVIALAATIGLATQDITAIGITPLVAGMVFRAPPGVRRARRRDPAVAAGVGRDAGHARASPDPAQLRRAGRRPRRLERLPLGRGARRR